MLTKKTVIQLLSDAVHGTEKEFFTDAEIDAFAESFVNREGLEEPDCRRIVDALIKYSDEKGKPCRRCSICGRLMREGYCQDMGYRYYCGTECLHKDFTDEEWLEECKNNDQSYYTEWF